jgi:hypothetical protein
MSDTYNGKPKSVWMRSLRFHTYEGKPQPEGAVYLAHDEIVETIETLKMGVREKAPPRAVRTAEFTPSHTTEQRIEATAAVEAPPTPAPTQQIPYTHDEPVAIPPSRSRRR